MTLDDGELLARMRAAHSAGLQICVHAIGDAAVERCVELYERLLPAAPRRDHRPRTGPVESPAGRRAIQCCVPREGFEPQQGLSPREALELFTRGAAWLQF